MNFLEKIGKKNLICGNRKIALRTSKVVAITCSKPDSDATTLSPSKSEGLPSDNPGTSRLRNSPQTFMLTWQETSKSHALISETLFDLLLDVSKPA